MRSILDAGTCVSIAPEYSGKRFKIELDRSLLIFSFFDDGE